MHTKASESVNQAPAPSGKGGARSFFDRGPASTGPFFQPKLQASTPLTPSVETTPVSSSVIQRIPNRNLSSPGSTSAGPQAAPPLPVVGSTPISDADFRLIMDRKYGVTTISTGTQSEQEASLTRHGLPAAAIPNWQSWSPGSSSIIYNYIVEAFDTFDQGFGAVPNVSSITFWQMQYDRDSTTGAITPNANTGASFGVTDLNIFEAITRLNHAIPFARSITGTYANSPGIAVTSTGSSPGAPMPLPSRSESVIRMITHELGHGAQSAAMNLPGIANAPDPSMMNDYSATVGWINTASPQLFDIGVPAVATAFANGTTPPATHQITSSNWNDPRWVEQPMSGYSVSGGPGEDFAESVMVYVTEPGLLQSRSPSRYRFIDTRRFLWMRNMRMNPRSFMSPPGDYPLRTLPEGTEYA